MRAYVLGRMYVIASSGTCTADVNWRIAFDIADVLSWHASVSCADMTCH